MVRPGIVLSQALKLITSVGKKARGGEVFILKMRLFRIAEVAQVMIEELGPKYGHECDAIKTEMIGIKAGEKLAEQLMTEREQQRAYETDEMFVVTPDLKELADVRRFYRDAAAKGEIKPCVSGAPIFANSSDIKNVLDNLDYL
jgi:FlaA1/EpsC-like NDP-sugar epimerase